MRYLIGFLLLANLAFYLWYPEAEAPAVQHTLPPTPPELTPLVLLSERHQVDDVMPSNGANPKQQEDTPPEKIVANATLPEPAPQPRCQTVGPFFDKGKVEKITRLLAKQGFQPRLRNSNAQAPAGYWVYLPAMEADAARAIVADLDEQGMKDYYIGKDYVISLGIFSDQAKAVTRRDRIADMGYPARLDQRYRTRKVYWLDVEETGQPLQVNPVWLKLLQENPKIAAQQVSCE